MTNQVVVSGEFTGSINFAMQQNYIPIIKYIRIYNSSKNNLENLTLKISFEPQFAKHYETKIERLLPDTSVEITPISILLSPEYFLSITEKMVGIIHMELMEGEECIYIQDDTIELLAYDEWSGLLAMPEIISAFITPNHPKIAELLQKAEEYLMKWTKDPSFSGYQTNNPHNIKLQMAAIYAVLQTENIVYHMPPASYEQTGQRIRLVDTVLTQKKGTCLDLSILYASCLEAVGLHPLLIFITGHAFVGCWLEEDTFSDCVQDDLAAITKRLAKGIDEIAVIECTDFVAGKSVSFDKAEEHANHHFLQTEQFLLAVDIIRSRGSGIRPIPIRVAENGQYTMQDYRKRNAGDITDAPEELEKSRHKIVDGKVEITKQKLWERKLLDLSLRNTLLNFRITKNAIQLMISDLSLTEDALAQREEFKVLPRPMDLVNFMMDSKIYEIENQKDLINSIAQSEFKSKRIRTFLGETELEQSMKNLYRQAKLSLEENGVNTLYLALGFLRWFETDLSEKPRYAPIILLPVDVIRKVADKSYIIRLRDEEPQMNITLLEMLRQDYGILIGGLDPLPADDNGIDLPFIFNTMRQAVMAKKRWDIEEFSFLGLFSFSQFIMWNDIHNRSDELMQNKVVSSLVSGKLEWTPSNKCISAEELDTKLLPADMAIPTSVDSSQLVAICASAAGQSFVLHGPPGTGKSQTITNMIANALYQGKSVLFVAEKMAALSVVQKRLEAIGLAPFCLELHSNKAQKKNVLDQLERTLQVGLLKKPEEYEATADKLHQFRIELNKVVDELHKKRSYGMSLYDAIVKYETLLPYYGKVKFSREAASMLTSDKDHEWKELLCRYKAAALECGGVKDTPFRFNESRIYSMEFRDSMKGVLSDYLEILKELKIAGKELTGDLKLQFKVNYEDYLTLSNIFQELMSTDYIVKPVIQNQNIEVSDAYLSSIIENGQSMIKIEQELKESFEPGIFEYDIQMAIRRWKKTEEAWFLPKWLEQKKLLKEIQSYSKNKENIQKENIQTLYQKLAIRAENYRLISSVDAAAIEQFGVLWNFGHPDWEKLSKVYRHSKSLNLSLHKIAHNREERAAVQNRICELADQLSSYQLANRERLPHYSLLVEQLMKVEKVLSDNYVIRVDQLRSNKEWIEDAILYADKLLQEINGVKEWTTFLLIQDEMIAKGLKDIVDAYHSGNVTEIEFLPGYECNIAYTIIGMILSESEILSKFQGTQFEETIARYKEILAENEILTIKEMAARLSSKLPRLSSGMAGSSEIGILQKSIKSGGRMMSIRRLFDSIPTLLRRLCPCMLMSPMSVAQYIDTKFPKFDLVVFDEASQLPTCEAVGTIARGENVIIVGDPKQLPPTSFFSSNQVDDDNYEKEDLESLLDDCLALSMPQEHLLWHYRSRHESLIAFSNMKYYDNKLYTFPSPDDVKSEVKLIPITGYYDKGASKQNKAEAEAVVAEIVRRLSDQELRKDSIGVVTFSSVQQILIDDLLMEAFHEQPELEKINNENSEPIFIKNLENVQGDERDVILFSVGYGPDKEGKISMNFGPLNRDGGWRRLNVAISRARKQMFVYAVLKPEEIDLSRTRSEGVAGLKGFLEFAGKGKSVLAIRNGVLTENHIHIQNIIAECLQKRGYDVKCNIGCSEYKIDLAILHPDKQDTYILGIMCDGINYQRSKTARDRNVLQPNVLKGLGWNILSVWTLDWLDNPEKVLKHIEAVIRKVLTDGEQAFSTSSDTKTETITGANLPGKGDIEKNIAALEVITENFMAEESVINRTVVEESLAETSEDETSVIGNTMGKTPVAGKAMGKFPIAGNAVSKISVTGKVERELPVTENAVGKLSAKDESMPNNIIVNSKVVNDSVVNDSLIKATENKSNKIVFEKVMEEIEGYRNKTEYKTAPFRVRGLQENFYSPIAVTEIRNCMNEIIQKESPISKRLLYKKVLAAWGITRSGSRVENILDHILNTFSFQMTHSSSMPFYWNHDQIPERYTIFRGADGNDDKRSMDDICPEEVSNAIQSVVEMQISLSRTDLIRETAKAFGFTRLGSIIEASVDRGIDKAVSRGYVTLSENGERISII